MGVEPVEVLGEANGLRTGDHERTHVPTHPDLEQPVELVEEDVVGEERGVPIAECGVFVRLEVSLVPGVGPVGDFVPLQGR